MRLCQNIYNDQYKLCSCICQNVVERNREMGSVCKTIAIGYYHYYSKNYINNKVDNIKEDNQDNQYNQDNQVYNLIDNNGLINVIIYFLLRC